MSAAAPVRSSRSTAARSASNSRRANCAATRPARSRVRRGVASAISRKRTAARSFSTKSAISHRRSRGSCCKRRQQRKRFEAVQEVRNRFRVDVQAVGDEQQVEFRGFGLPGERADEVHVDAGVGDRVRMPPGGHVAGRALDDGAEMDRAGGSAGRWAHGSGSVRAGRGHASAACAPGSVGRASRSDAVYGCDGTSNTRSTGPLSITRPRRITRIRSATW